MKILKDEKVVHSELFFDHELTNRYKNNPVFEFYVYFFDILYKLSYKFELRVNAVVQNL